MSSTQSSSIHQALNFYHKQYNPLLRMLSLPAGSVTSIASPILRNLHIHPTRESLLYAIALLDTDESRFTKRAIAIISRILSLQDVRPESLSYGTWPRFLEGYLINPRNLWRSDPNWTNFLGMSLLQIRLRHAAILPSTLLNRIDGSVLHCAEAIQRRDVTLIYSNIAVLAVYVTLITAETYQIKSLEDYALDRLRQFHELTFKNGCFAEYNSPNYMLIILRTLNRLWVDAKSPEAKQLAHDLYQHTWQEIAQYFHPPTLQWSGPHSRSYSTLLDYSTLVLIEKSTSEKVAWNLIDRPPILNSLIAPKFDNLCSSLQCPKTLETSFISLQGSHTVLRNITQGKSQITLTTYLNPDLSLGSVSHSDLWEQRRSLVAYWGTRQNPKYIRLRFLKDGKDLAAAQFFSVQNETKVLGGITFATDINTENPYIQDKEVDPHNFKFFTQDLRLRFEVNDYGLIGNLSDVSPGAREIRLSCDNLHFRFYAPYAYWEDQAGYWQIQRKGSLLYLDLVLYSGKRRCIHLSKLARAAIGFAFEITTSTPAAKSHMEVLSRDQYLEMSWGDLYLKFLQKPSPQNLLWASCK
jgi:hypothetical protein